MLEEGVVRTRTDKITCLFLPLAILLSIEYDIVEIAHRFFVVRRNRH